MSGRLRVDGFREIDRLDFGESLFDHPLAQCGRGVVGCPGVVGDVQKFDRRSQPVFQARPALFDLQGKGQVVEADEQGPSDELPARPAQESQAHGQFGDAERGGQMHSPVGPAGDEQDGQCDGRHSRQTVDAQESSDAATE